MDIVHDHNVKPNWLIDNLHNARVYLDSILNSKTRISTFKRAGIQGLEYAIEVHGRYTAKDAFHLADTYKKKGWNNVEFELTHKRTLTLIFN